MIVFLIGVPNIRNSLVRIKNAGRVSLYRNSLYLILEYAVTGIFGFVFWILAARFYSDAEVGLTSAAISIGGFLIAVSLLGTDFGIIRFLPGSGNRANALVNTSFSVGILAAIVTSLVFLAGVGLWSPELVPLRQHALLAGSFMLLIVAGLLYPQINNTFVAWRRAEFSLGLSIVQGVTKLAIVPFLSFAAYGVGIVASYAAGWALAALVCLLVFLPRLQNDYRPSFTLKKDIVRDVAHYSITNYIASLITKVPLATLPLIVLSQLGADQNAYFYIAFSVIAGGLNSVPASIALSLFAEGSHDESSLEQHVRQSIRFSFLLLMPLIVVLFIIGGRLLLLFGSAYSEQATMLLRVFVIATVPFTINTIYFYKKRVERQMRNVIILTTVSGIIILGLSYVLLPSMGIVGAGIAWLAGHGAVSLFTIGDLLKRTESNTSDTVGFA